MNQTMHRGIQYACDSSPPRSWNPSVLLQRSPPGLISLILAYAPGRVVHRRRGDVAVRHVHQSVAHLLLEADGPDFARYIAHRCVIAFIQGSFQRLLLPREVILYIPEYRPPSSSNRSYTCNVLIFFRRLFVCAGTGIPRIRSTGGTPARYDPHPAR